MDVRQEELLLLDDVVRRTVVNPTASHCWHQMIQILRRQANPALSLKLEQFLLLNVAGDGLAGFYRATFLDMLTGRPEYLQQAGQIILTLQPLDADRLITFLQNSWQRVLLDTPGRDAFRQRLHALELPRIAALLNQCIWQNLQPVKVLSSRLPTRIGKVALVAPLLTNIKHPPTLMALQQADSLRQNGYEVALFAAQEMLGPDFKHFLGSHSFTPEPEFSTAGWERYLGQGGQFVTGDMRFSMMQRWKSLLHQMAQFDPDLVMSVGLYSGLAAALYPARPVLSLGINSLSPMLPADGWLTAQQGLHATVAAQWGAAFPPSQAHYHPYRLHKPDVTEHLEREALGLATNQPVLLTLVSESEARITGEWAASMLAILAAFPDTVWFIVGGNGAMPTALQSAKTGQVRCIAFCTDAVKYMTCSDVYINPPMMGGGFAVAEAMSLGLPALSMQGSDGGDKVGSAAMTSMAEYFQTLQVWLSQPEIRKSAGLAMQDHFHQHLDLAHAAPNLKIACELALQRFQIRMAVPIS